MTSFQQLQSDVCTLHDYLPSNNLVSWTSGNISGRISGENRMVIKTSGLLFEDLTPETLARQAFNTNQPEAEQLQFVVEDSAGDMVQASVAFGRLIADDRVVAILGPATSSAAAAVFVVQWYARVGVLTTAIRQAGSRAPAAIRDALASLQGIDTVLGEFSFNAEGSAVFDPVVLIVRDGMLVPF